MQEPFLPTHFAAPWQCQHLFPTNNSHPLSASHLTSQPRKIGTCPSSSNSHLQRPPRVSVPCGRLFLEVLCDRTTDAPIASPCTDSAQALTRMGTCSACAQSLVFFFGLRLRVIQRLWSVAPRTATFSEWMCSSPAGVDVVDNDSLRDCGSHLEHHQPPISTESDEKCHSKERECVPPPAACASPARANQSLLHIRLLVHWSTPARVKSTHFA